MASADRFMLDPSRLRLDWTDAVPPLACIDLDDISTEALRRPPFPLIGLGDPAHPQAHWCDAVIEPPVTIDRIVDAVTRCPNAAAATVQMLRSIEGLASDRALTMESIGYAMLQGSAEHARWLESRPTPAPMPPGRIVVTRDGATLHITMDRPASRNAIDRAFRDSLHDAFTLAALDHDITRVEWRGCGAAFCVGADLSEFGTTRDPASAHALRGRTLPAGPLSQCGARVVVHVQGACIGSGLEMAAFAGRIIAARSAWFQLPELAMGVLPGAGGCVSIPRRIGRRRTALMILSGKRIDAATALRWGLVDAIVDQDTVDPGRPDPD